jgi:hypothetical protein
MSKQEEARLYKLVREAIKESFTVKGYSVDFEITGHPKGRFIPERFLKSEVLLKHRRDRLPTPDIMGLVRKKVKQDKQELVIVEVKQRPTYQAIFQAKGYDELFYSDFTYLISQQPLYMSSMKVLDFVEERPELLSTRNGKWITIQFLHKTPEGKITLAQLGSEVGKLPPPIL